MCQKCPPITANLFSNFSLLLTLVSHFAQHPNQITQAKPLLGYLHLQVYILPYHTHSGIAVPASGNITLFYIVERKALIIHVHTDNIIVEKINILWACQTHLSEPRVRYVASDTHDCVGSYAVFLIIAFHRAALVHCQPK